MATQDLLTVHSRYCAARNRGTAVVLSLFSAGVVFLKYRALHAPPPKENRDIIVSIAVIAVIVFLAQLMAVLRCVRERLLLALAITSFAVDLASRLLPKLSVPASGSFRAGSLILWIAVLLVSLSLLASALRSG